MKDVIEILGLGAVGLLVFAAVLLLLVFRELAPQGGLTGRGRWLLAGGLGTGVVAFGGKLLLIVALIKLPDGAMAPRPVTERVVVEPYSHRHETQGRGNPAAGAHYVWQALPERAPVPGGAAVTPEKAALGERLFHDPALSRDRSVSCSSCHDVSKGAGTDGRATSVGIDGKVGQRNAPTVWNAAFQSVLFWDGRAASLEEQAVGPMTNPLEMGMPSLDAVAARVRENPSYPEAFARAFGDPAVTIDRIAAAIAAYERTLITPDTPYDRFVRGDESALTPSQLRGMALFQEVGCVLCHSGPNFSAAGIAGQGGPWRIFPAIRTPYESRFDLTADPGAAPAGDGRGIWRIPSLRNVALTGPYFHNGSVDRLEDAVRIMASVQLGRPLRDDPRNGRTVIWSAPERTLTSVLRAPLGDEEVDDVVAFLNALSSDRLVSREHEGQGRLQTMQ